VCARRILTLDAMPTKKQEGLVEPSAHIASSKGGVECATNYWSLAKGEELCCNVTHAAESSASPSFQLG
jgi:hypothetical protein